MTKAEFMQRVRAMERRLYRVSRTMLSCSADCEDAVQETLLKAWARLGTLREAKYFETWLVRILINECRTIWRRRPKLETELADKPDAASNDEHRIFEMLISLPEKHRITMELHYIEGYRTREIAGLLGIPESTVKWRLAQGRKILKRELGDEAQACDR